MGAALLGDSFRRFWERGERSVGPGVDAASDTGAFRLYERAGMAPALGAVMYEKKLGDAASDSGSSGGLDFDSSYPCQGGEAPAS